MKFFDVCVIGLVSIVFLSRLPSPLYSLKCDFMSKKRLISLSAVCDLLGLLVACDYVASRFSKVGHKYSGWIVAETACWVGFGLLFGPATRAFRSRLFAKNPSRTSRPKLRCRPDKDSTDEEAAVGVPGEFLY
jgi:hypothetical protein